MSNKSGKSVKSLILSFAVVVVIVAIVGVLIWRQQIKSGIGPTWRGITIGKSTSADVIALLGKPNKTENYFLETVYLYQESRYLSWAHRVVFRQNVVWLIEENALQYPHELFLSDLVQRYGNPSVVTWSREGPGSRIVVYPDAGVLANVIALPLEEAYITKVFYFQPRAEMRIMIDFSSQISLTDPFPSSDILGPEDPWFGTSRESRGP